MYYVSELALCMYKERNRTYNINQDYPCLNEKNLDDISIPPIRNNHAIQLYQKKIRGTLYQQIF